MIVLIADDLTGASDAGVQFARRGLPSLVVLDGWELATVKDAGAVAVSTDTRDVTPQLAYAKVRGVADQLVMLHPDFVYKKVDSTLRGNLASEIDAVMDGFGLREAVVAPAYPAQGRTTRGGIQYLRGVPVNQAEPGRDPKAPVEDADLIRTLRSGSRRQVGHIGLETIRGGLDAIRAEFIGQASNGIAVLVCDAETSADLEAITWSLAGFKAAGLKDVLWVGSAGLAEQFVTSVGFRASVCDAVPLAVDGPVLVAAGSLSEVTRRQVAALVACTCVYDADGLAELHAALAAGQDAVVMGRPELLADVTADCVKTHHVGALVLTGGDTARAICRELGVVAIELLDEVEPGVPVGRLIGGECDRLLVVTKAGAFGSDPTLLHALQKLKGGNGT